MTVRWSNEDVDKLKSWAGKRNAAEIAADLGRGVSATYVKAHLLKVSLRVKHPQMEGAADQTLAE